MKVLKHALWSLAYRRWRARPAPVAGYTLLLTVPPDLPAFLHLAVETCRLQDPTHRIETLVIPDQWHPPFRHEFEAAARRWPEGRLRLVEPGPLARLLRPFLATPSLIHWLQLVAGVAATRTTHAILHDVDLFMLEGDFLRSLHEACRDGAFACVGNAPPWQGAPWAKLPRFAHVVALWELAFDVGWMTSMPPAALRPQHAVFPEARFWFETTLLAQARAEPTRIARHRAADLVHFGWVVGCYRTFERTRGAFEDDRFRLLLIRLLTDAFAPDAPPSAIPPHADLVRGLTDPTARVCYGAAARGNWPEFQGTLQRLLVAAPFAPDRMAALRDGLRPFEDHFGPVGAPADVAP